MVEVTIIKFYLKANDVTSNLSPKVK